MAPVSMPRALVVDDATVATFSTTVERDDEDVLSLLVAGGQKPIIADRRFLPASTRERDDEDVVLLLAACAG